MIVFVEGRLASKSPTQVVLAVGGIGYEVFIPLSSYDRLPAPGEVCRLLTVDHVREDAHILYGFVTEAERSLFTKLITVTGIGPKIALSVLSGMSVREFKAAIVQADSKRLCSIPGIGRKTADRLIVELRDKIGEGEALEAISGAEEDGDTRIRDAVLALVALGYKQVDARTLVLRIPVGEEDDVETMVRRALTAQKKK